MKMYIFPKKEIDTRDNIRIYDKTTGRSSWYDKYEIDVNVWMKGGNQIFEHTTNMK
jgi:hypothetical protein